MTRHPQRWRDTLLAAIDRNTRAVDLLLFDEEVHKPFSPLWWHLPKPQADEAPGAATGLRSDGDGFAFAGFLQGLAHRNFPLRRRGPWRRCARESHGDGVRVELQLLFQPLRPFLPIHFLPFCTFAPGHSPQPLPVNEMRPLTIH